MSILIGKRISLPQCGSVHICGIVGNSKLTKGEDMMSGEDYRTRYSLA